MVDSGGKRTTFEHWTDQLVYPEDPYLRTTVYCTNHPIPDHVDLLKDFELPAGVEVWKVLEKKIDRAKLMKYPGKRIEKRFLHRKVRACLVAVRTDTHVTVQWKVVDPEYDPDEDGISTTSSMPRPLLTRSGFDERHPPPTTNHFQLPDDTLHNSDYPSFTQRNRYGTDIQTTATPAPRRRVDTPAQSLRTASSSPGDAQPDDSADGDYGRGPAKKQRLPRATRACEDCRRQRKQCTHAGERRR